jgi:hypothetical protein
MVGFCPELLICYVPCYFPAATSQGVSHAYPHSIEFYKRRHCHRSVLDSHQRCKTCIAGRQTNARSILCLHTLIVDTRLSAQESQTPPHTSDEMMPHLDGSRVLTDGCPSTAGDAMHQLDGSSPAPHGRCHVAADAVQHSNTLRSSTNGLQIGSTARDMSLDLMPLDQMPAALAAASQHVGPVAAASLSSSRPTQTQHTIGSVENTPTQHEPSSDGSHSIAQLPYSLQTQHAASLGATDSAVQLPHALQGCAVAPADVSLEGGVQFWSPPHSSSSAAGAHASTSEVCVPFERIAAEIEMGNGGTFQPQATSGTQGSVMETGMHSCGAIWSSSPLTEIGASDLPVLHYRGRSTDRGACVGAGAGSEVSMPLPSQEGLRGTSLQQICGTENAAVQPLGCEWSTARERRNSASSADRIGRWKHDRSSSVNSRVSGDGSHELATSPVATHAPPVVFRPELNEPTVANNCEPHELEIRQPNSSWAAHASGEGNDRHKGTMDFSEEQSGLSLKQGGLLQSVCHSGPACADTSSLESQEASAAQQGSRGVIALQPSMSLHSEQGYVDLMLTEAPLEASPGDCGSPGASVFEAFHPRTVSLSGGIASSSSAAPAVHDLEGSTDATTALATDDRGKHLEDFVEETPRNMPPPALTIPCSPPPRGSSQTVPRETTLASDSAGVADGASHSGLCSVQDEDPTPVAADHTVAKLSTCSGPLSSATPSHPTSAAEMHLSEAFDLASLHLRPPSRRLPRPLMHPMPQLPPLRTHASEPSSPQPLSPSPRPSTAASLAPIHTFNGSCGIFSMRATVCGILATALTRLTTIPMLTGADLSAHNAALMRMHSDSPASPQWPRSPAVMSPSSLTASTAMPGGSAPPVPSTGSVQGPASPLPGSPRHTMADSVVHMSARDAQIQAAKIERTTFDDLMQVCCSRRRKSRQLVCQ